MNIIENSRKGAATDSAYGYKDSVNKTYIAELQTSNKLKLDGTYTVNSDGSLTPADEETNFGDDRESLNVQVSGTIPSSGSLTYENNVLTEGWLVIGEYKVEFKTNGTVTTTKNTSSSSNEQSSGGNDQSGSGSGQSGNQTQSVIQLYGSDKTTPKDKSNVAVGDWVKIEEEEFEVINPNKNGKVVLLAQYNLSYTIYSEDEDEFVEVEDRYIQDPHYMYDGAYPTMDFYFSTMGTYWYDSDEGYQQDYETDIQGYRYIYRTRENNQSLYTVDTENDIYPVINTYKSYLETKNVNIEDARLMSYAEAYSLSPSQRLEGKKADGNWRDNGYWLGSESRIVYPYDDEYYEGYIWYVDINGNLSDYGANGGENGMGYGIRPVIEISISNF